MSLPSLAVKFTIIDLLSKGVDRIRSRLLSLTSANREVQKSFERMNKSLKWGAIAGVATAELSRRLKPAISVAGDLQEEMLGVRAEMLGSVRNSKELAENLKRVKASAFTIQAFTPYDMSQIVALEKQLIKSGAKIQDVVAEGGAAAAAAALATYEKLDPVATGKGLKKIATPFGIAASEFMKLADNVSRASSASTTGTEAIIEAAQYASGPMADLGRSSKEMLIFSAMLAQSGVEGGRAGTSIRAFFREAVKIKALRNSNGELKETGKVIKILQKRLEGLGSAEKSKVLGKLFGDEGKVLASALLREGEGAYEQIIDAMEHSASLQDKLAEAMKGLNKQWESLTGTKTSVIADLFQPALRPLSAIVAKTNEFWTALGKASQRSEALGETVSGLSLSAVGVGGATTLALGGAGLWYGRKVLKGVGGWKGLLRGAGGTATGIATGKAVEAATGVQPVFVTNWPQGFGGGMTGLAAQGAGAWMSRLGKLGKGLLPFLLGLGPGAILAGVLAAIPLAAWHMSKKSREKGYVNPLRDLPGTSTLVPPKTFSMMPGREEILRHAVAGMSLSKTDLDRASRKPDNIINLNLHIDDSGRMTSRVDDMSTHVTAKLNRGNFIN